MSPRPGAHRARARYGRVTVLSGAVAVTVVALLAGWGVFPEDDGAEAAEPAAVRTVGDGTSEEDDLDDDAAAPTPDAPEPTRSSDRGRTGTPPRVAAPSGSSERTLPAPPVARRGVVPAGSGSGRRVVFSEAAQRVWLIGDDESVQRTYPVSGSTLDNLDPGTYEVYSRSEDAWGIDDSGTMEWFVRFTRGPSGAAIGFHTIPEKDGAPLQTVAQLGTPQSHGCIRQDEADALALWDFAPLGTTVVVV
ncbi:L,D-transpeptidase [Nocardioides insulae]|uniref:L,D-transpeptidase n=1 Tax=Nocardioides insulae TaxID=394734 RepID=UPI0012FB0FCB|nr:L,D-transpeptidase [Nocardioides insulae]